MGKSLEILKICQGHTAQSFRQFEAYLEQNLFYTTQKQISIFARHNITSQKEFGFLSPTSRY